MDSRSLAVEAHELALRVIRDPVAFLQHLSSLQAKNQQLSETAEILTERNIELKQIIDRAFEHFVRGDLQSALCKGLLIGNQDELVAAKVQINDIADAASRLAFGFHQMSSEALGSFNHHCTRAIDRALENISTIKSIMSEQMADCEDERARANYLEFSNIVSQCAEAPLSQMVVDIESVVSATRAQFDEIQFSLDDAAATLAPEMCTPSSTQMSGRFDTPDKLHVSGYRKSKLATTYDDSGSEQDTLIDSDLSECVSDRQLSSSDSEREAGACEDYYLEAAQAETYWCESAFPSPGYLPLN